MQTQDNTPAGRRTAASREMPGRRFGKLVVLGYSHTAEGTHWWTCRCDCGAEKAFRQFSLRRGRATSCGTKGCRQKYQLEGRRFGRLTVLSRSHQLADWHWLGRCDCGTEKTIDQNSLVHGRIVSCGCYNRDKLVERSRTHGRSKTPEYMIWACIKKRCLNPKCDAYDNYGGRGITICDRWSASFEAFMEDMGPRPGPAMEVDRIDNDRGYEPGNCRWATPQEQCNNKRTNRRIEFRGETKTIAEWERALGFATGRLNCRLSQGWTVERALTQPVRPRRTGRQRREAEPDGKSDAADRIESP